QRRHKRDYIETFKQVSNGAIGDIVGGNVYWNTGQLWYREPRPEWSEMEYMIRDWVNWTWLSGDHIVEQHVHNLDVFLWFTGMTPQSAVAFGSRQRRVTGDQYDNFSVDFVYENGMHLHSMCRQIDGCARNVAEYIRGTKGYAEMDNGGLQEIYDTNSNLVWEYDYPEQEDSESRWNVKNPYVQEHVDLVTNIRNNTPIVEAEATAQATMMAIMGRLSAYTGTEVTWDEMMSSDLELGPAQLQLGPVSGVNREVAVPGTAS
ncbi:MAG TPA: Gfo/Idh/MocA family oxidoreductase, partial [bacterium]|nr:Gfo/Idh/MocA family oxidoreductase [bacterium]